ncbi:MAG TPA: hypothetical protein VF088_01380, partial [Pyrinomonadaceae bacterium]
KVICDLMTRGFFEKYGKTIHEKLTGMGASFKFTVDNPEEIFLKNGYSCIERISIIEKSMAYSGAPAVLRMTWKILARGLLRGYSIYVFSHGLNG